VAGVDGAAGPGPYSGPLLGDVFSSALWPYDYYDPFWAYGAWPDFDYGDYGTAYAYGGGYDIYGDSGNADGGYAGRGPTTTGSARAATPTVAPQFQAEVVQSCGGFAPGVISFPIERIRQAVQPTSEQAAALNNLDAAAKQASAAVDASCPSEPPLTPLGRLAAVEQRLDATIKAIDIVRPALARLYDSLDDPQRQRLDAVGAEPNRGPSDVGARGKVNDLASLCGRQAEGFTKLPVERIEESVKPSGRQRTALDDLEKVSAQTAEALRGSCPVRPPQNPVARLDAMGGRLQAMVRAAEELRPKLGAFYASLNDEQKARFNAMGQQNAGLPENQNGRQ
jgi:hypothetical protein